jgi:hypothetical protein
MTLRLEAVVGPSTGLDARIGRRVQQVEKIVFNPNLSGGERVIALAAMKRCG